MTLLAQYFSNTLKKGHCYFIPGRGIQLVQRKKTIYPEWNTCFDAHLYEGRVIQMVAMERPNRFLADVTVSAKALADKCTDSNIATLWVRLFL